VGRDGLIVLCTPEKLHALQGRPLLMNTNVKSVFFLSKYSIPIMEAAGGE
jgi:hypothetical protein